MTLAKARAEANKAFREARAVVIAGQLSARSASEGLIAVFWGIGRRLKGRDKTLFIAWFERKHDALGKEIGAKLPSTRSTKRSWPNTRNSSGSI